MSTLISLIKSASRRDWKPHPAPSWAKDRTNKIILDSITALIEKGVNADQFENDKKVKCQYSHAIVKSIMNEGKTRAPALMRYINSTEYLDEDQANTESSDLAGKYSSDTGITATTAKIFQLRNGNYTLEYTTMTTSGCTGEFSGTGEYEEGEVLVFVDSNYPDCRVRVTPTSSLKEIDISSTEGCQVLSGMRCGIYGHLTKE